MFDLEPQRVQLLRFGLVGMFFFFCLLDLHCVRFLCGDFAELFGYVVIFVQVLCG